MASNSGRKSGSSGRSSSRTRVVIGAEETTRVRYSRDKPEVESERRQTARQSKSGAARKMPTAGKSSPAGRRMASEKRDERDRRRRAIARRRAALIAVVALATVAAVWALAALWRAPLLPVKVVTVSGVRRLSTESVLASAAIPSGATLPRLAKSEIIARLTANPWIGSASVSRSLPGTVRITVAERTPAAIVDAGGTELWLISADGHWLARRSAEDTQALPTIREAPGVVPLAGKVTDSPELMNALQVVGGLSPELHSRVKTVVAPTIDKTALTLDDTIQVFVGEATDMAKKDRLVRDILAKDQKLVYINVRVVDHPVWRGLDSKN